MHRITGIRTDQSGPTKISPITYKIGTSANSLAAMDVKRRPLHFFVPVKAYHLNSLINTHDVLVVSSTILDWSNPHDTPGVAGDTLKCNRRERLFAFAFVEVLCWTLTPFYMDYIN